MYNVSGGANWAGKLRTCINFPLICVIYHFEESPTPLVNATFLYVFEGVALLMNILSVYIYSRRYWPYLHLSAGLGSQGRETVGPEAHTDDVPTAATPGAPAETDESIRTAM